MMRDKNMLPGVLHKRAPTSSAMMKKGGGWNCEHGAKCLVPCPGCPYVGRPQMDALCKMCRGLGYVTTRNGEDSDDCPRCNGTGKERHV